MVGRARIAANKSKVASYIGAGVIGAGGVTPPPVAGTIGGMALGAAGAVGTYREGYKLVDGDEFASLSAADFVRPGNDAGTLMTTRNYGVQSTAPRYPRGAASLAGYEADPFHTGFADANRGAVPASYADLIRFNGGTLKVKSRRATAAEKALMGPLAKGNVSSMVHFARRNLMRAPCIMDMNLRFPSALASWAGWHPTFWLLQDLRGFNGLELDCEGFSAALQFNRNTWANGAGQYGPTLGNTAAVSKTEFRTYTFKVEQVSGTWTVFLYENDALVASGPANYGGNTFDPTRPFYLMMTNHILQSDLTQSVWDAAGDDGATIECDWWRSWGLSSGAYRAPALGHQALLAPFNTDFSFTLPSPADVWGSGVSADTLESIANEDNAPAIGNGQGFWASDLPTGMTRTGNVLTGKITDNPGRLMLQRSYTPANGDGCRPQPITLCIGPRIKASTLSGTQGQAFEWDAYADADCGDLHLGKTIAFTGLAAAGGTYNSSTGKVTFSTATTRSATFDMTVTNSAGQTATKTITVNVSAASSAFAHEGLASLIGQYDASDDASFGSESGAQSAWANKKGAAGALSKPSDTTQTTDRFSAVQNGRDIMRATRGGAPATNSIMEAAAGVAISQMLVGTNKDFTLAVVFKPTASATGFVCGWSEPVDGATARQCGIVRRTTASSLRYGLDSAAAAAREVDVGTIADNAWHVLVWKHLAGTTTCWIDSASTKRLDAVTQAPTAVFSAPTFAIGNMRTNNNTSPSFAGTGFGGDEGEVLAFNAGLTDAECQQMVTDLAAKWGVTLS